jgi:hypothetical protein
VRPSRVLGGQVDELEVSVGNRVEEQGLHPWPGVSLQATGVPGLRAPGIATGAKRRPTDRSWAAGLLTDRGGTTMDYLVTMTTQVPNGVADSTSESTTS